MAKKLLLSLVKARKDKKDPFEKNVLALFSYSTFITRIPNSILEAY